MGMLVAPYRHAVAGGGGPIATGGIGTYLLVVNGWASANHTLPAYSAGDYVFMQAQLNTSGGAATLNTPSGWTLLESGFHATSTDGFYLFYKKMTGSEGASVNITPNGTVGANAVLQVQSVAVQGLKQSGTFYESLFRYQQRHYVSPAKGLSLQAHGSNRIALHFYFGGQTSANPIAPAVDAFTDLWSEHTTSGVDGAIACSYKTISATELTAAEQRTGNNGNWAVISLVVIADSETAGSPLARRYWRVRGLWQFSGTDDQTMAVAEMEMRLTAAGADQTSAANAIASSEFSGSFADDFAFNNDGGTTLWSSVIGTWYNHWVGQDFGSGNDKQIAEVVYTAAGGGGAAASPKDGIIEASPDGTNWEGRKYFHDLTWSAGSSNTISVP